ncbi:MAG TPA: ABC transporter ATP-binding protein [Methylomirabilota bacterium]|jgi:ABC-type sugar transport system ATPase subunit
MARVELIDVSKTLTNRDRSPAESASASSGNARGATFSLQNLSLTILDGQTTVILGPSGCGKTTVLKIIAGLLAPDSGAVRYDGVDMDGVRPGDRGIGMVFQNYALYPHLKSRTNVLSYFLFRKKTPALDALAAAKYQRTSELMGVELAHLLDRKPATLSGGEKQRVALARCITRDAALFLVDEPFANLDQALREKYRVNLKILLRQFSITTVYVTHDHNEALILGDVLAIMSRGRIEQVGSCEEIYARPTNAFVAGFLNVHTGAPPISFIDAGSLPRERASGRARVGVRPDEVGLSATPTPDSIRGTITAVLSLPMKNATTVSIRIGEDEIHAQGAGGQRFVVGDPAWVTFHRYHVFDKESGVRLRSYPADDAGRR